MKTFLLYLLNAIFTLKLMDQLQNKKKLEKRSIQYKYNTQSHNTEHTLIWRPRKNVSLDELGVQEMNFVFCI